MNNNELVNEDGYTLNELIDKYRYSEVEWEGWDEYVIEDWTEKLAELGYTDAKIMYSGFCSQGDGAGFESGYDIEKFIENNKPLIIQWTFPNVSVGIDDIKECLSFSIKHCGSYYHKYSFSLSVDIVGDPQGITDEKLESIADELEKTLEAERLDLCGQIYRDLEEEYNHMTSDEYIKEYLINNDLWEEPETEAEPMRQAA